MSFETGFIPKGWVRGQMLRVHRLQDNGTGYIELETRGIPFDPNKKFETDDVAVMAYSKWNVEKVNAWLKWWRE